MKKNKKILKSMLSEEQKRKYNVIESSGTAEYVDPEYQEIIDLVRPWKKTKKGKTKVRLNPKIR